MIQTIIPQNESSRRKPPDPSVGGKFSSRDLSFMRRALACARRGAGLTQPNPMVGAIIVKDNRIIGKGWHHRAGAAHAEVDALDSTSESPRGATMYVTLEPCNHHGKTPPCSRAIIESGIATVVVAMADPNPSVSGGGFQTLREAGIDVKVGCCNYEAQALNRRWIHWLETQMPFVALKLAISLDFKIAQSDYSSKWFSGKRSRWQVQRLRRLYGAVMVGANTVEYDDPRLDYRLGDEPQPACVVVDPNLRTSLSRGIYQTQNRRPVLVAASIDAAPKQVQRFQAQGIEVVQLPVEDGKLQLKPLLKELGSRGIQGLLCEGGGLLGSSLFSQELCNRMLLYRVPKIVGSGGISALVPDSMPDNIEFCLIHSQVIAQDVLSVYDVQYNTVPKIGK